MRQEPTPLSTEDSLFSASSSGMMCCAGFFLEMSSEEEAFAFLRTFLAPNLKLPS
ncbi:hypothetical protein N9L68_01365 [bacterium]|nr:hypothetical protein [bacterium]